MPIGDFPSASYSGEIWLSQDRKNIIAEAEVTPEVWLLENFEPK
jgi:hypothetical protein